MNWRLTLLGWLLLVQHSKSLWSEWNAAMHCRSPFLTFQIIISGCLFAPNTHFCSGASQPVGDAQSRMGGQPNAERLPAIMKTSQSIWPVMRAHPFLFQLHGWLDNEASAPLHDHLETNECRQAASRPSAKNRCKKSNPEPIPTSPGTTC